MDITREFNFGCELYTCLTPFHEKFPAQIINVKFEQFILCSSRKVQGTLLKIMAIYENSSFTQALDKFLKNNDSAAPVEKN